MVNFTVKKDHRLPLKADWSNYYRKNFAVALLNWEINRQEERLEAPKSERIKK
ncbi:MAG TPA: hypothetical protein VL728_10305 [Cyclobacteriaceae bacterium]|jgi:hypothetical protein|nr:hypothetical protein [Cyclobacteriaceae bacterium]